MGSKTPEPSRDDQPMKAGRRTLPDESGNESRIAPKACLAESKGMTRLANALGLDAVLAIIRERRQQPIYIRFHTVRSGKPSNCARDRDRGRGNDDENSTLRVKLVQGGENGGIVNGGNFGQPEPGLADSAHGEHASAGDNAEVGKAEAV